MNRYHDQIRSVVTAAQPFSRGRFRWFGRLSRDVDPRLRDLLLVRPDIARDHLLTSLAHRLYVDFYQPGSPRAVPAPRAGSPRASESRRFLSEITRANQGVGRRQPGWEITGIEHPDVMIRRDGFAFSASTADLDIDPQARLHVGQQVSLRLPKQLAAMSPGFVTILSDRPFPAAGPVVRVYWNLHHWGVGAFIESITTALNEDQIPFSLKVINDPDGYNRCDAGVLRVHRADLERSLPGLEFTYGRVHQQLKQPVPGLTRSIAPGVGIAEEPVEGLSFGLHRCTLIAEGLVAAWEQGSTPFDTIVERFRSEDIDLARPYLNPGSGDDDITLTPPASHQSVHPREVERTTDNQFMDVARSIGDELCRTAIWQGDRCNWIGVQPRDPNAPAHHGMSHASLGPDLYNGSSGVALFLAELAAIDGGERTCRTALGAVRHALSRYDAIPPRFQLGLFTGIPGLCLATARVAELLDETDLLNEARTKLTGIRTLTAGEREFDLLGGLAGAISACVLLRKEMHRDDFIDVARTLGDALVDTAEPVDGGVAWPSASLPGRYPLTGLSHGAAGIAVALLELWHVTGIDSYHDIAEQAIDFEQAWFDAEQRNWPDFREAPLRDGSPEPPFHFAAHWCHGAPGIALSRLRAWELTGDSRYRDHAIEALLTTEQAVRQALFSGTGNYSLCHGLSGNAEILLRGHHVLGSEFAHLVTTAHLVAHEGIRLYSPPKNAWPCGTHGGWTPGLMLGLAGIGRFYLHASTGSLPCLLLPGLS